MKKYILPFALCAALAVSLAVAAHQAGRARQAETTLRELYASAMHESHEEMNALALHMEKLLLTADPARAAEHLHAISAAAGDVRQCLSVLPMPHEALASTLAYANELEYYTASLLTEVVSGGALPQSAQALLTEQLAACTRLSGQLALTDGDFAALKHLADRDGGMEYPPLNAAQPGPPRGLPEGDVTQEEAELIAQQFVGPDRVVSTRSAPGTTGLMPAYGVSIQTEDVLLNLEVTRQGGKVLWMMPETAAFPETQSIEACRQAAADFLLARDFPPMAEAGHLLYDGLCVFSFAPVQEGVVLYPDLLKVQIRMDTAQVVGFEAHNYWANHTQRALTLPQMTAEEAQKKLSAWVEVDSARLCLLPEGVAETLCYEFAVTYNGMPYLIYLDAATGREVQLLKLVVTPEGTQTA